MPTNFCSNWLVYYRHRTKEKLAVFSDYICRRPSVCRLSICLLRSCDCDWFILRRLKFSAMFLRHLVRWPSVDIQVKFYGDHPRGTPPSWELNTRRVAEYSDFQPIKRYISVMVQDRS